MSSTTTVIATYRQNSLQPFPASRSRLDQFPPARQLDRRPTNKTSSVAHPNMSSATAYYGQRVVPYEAMTSSRDTYNVAQMDRWSAARDTQTWQDGYQAYSVQNSGQPRQQYQQPPHVPLQARQATSNIVSRQPTRPSTPNSTHSSQTALGSTLGGDAQSMVLHSMQIPARISTKGGNLADFAAQVSQPLTTILLGLSDG